jgi:pSer/pThr/pTyr-binding forkhead associated (FHA) protein
MAFHSFALSPAERSDLLDADRRGEPYIAYRDRSGSLSLLALEERDRVAVGRGIESDLSLDWDEEVSRVHALFERVAGRWTIVDDGLSRNGTFVNGQRIVGRRALTDRDVLRFGHTDVLFCAPEDRMEETPLAKDAARLVRLSEAQRRVLVALCRPASAGELLVTASNAEIAGELSVSVEAVRTHLKALFQRFEVPDLPQNRKRSELARRALAAGIVTERDLHI